jgi:hypothetical protein
VRGCEWPREGDAHVLGRHMRPSASRMCPIVCCMCPFDRRMRPTVCRMRPLRRRMRPTVCRVRPLRRHMRPSASVCAPQPAICARSNPDHPTWQRCGSHRGQSKSRFTLSKVNKTLTLIGRTRTVSDVTDGQMDETDARTHRQPWYVCGTIEILHTCGDGL